MFINKLNKYIYIYIFTDIDLILYDLGVDGMYIMWAMVWTVIKLRLAIDLQWFSTTGLKIEREWTKSCGFTATSGYLKEKVV